MVLGLTKVSGLEDLKFSKPILNIDSTFIGSKYNNILQILITHGLKVGKSP